ncbi:restriction endonuclease subunit S [Actinorugispora endophytica]|uniref:Type I restriction enzyme S subunit n=1 Tax=Actinorugispora endophytica TaxID=1605990 RepID=A0A4R6V2C7_9ACTN|nr:restriction endonuclease subunit S [Actinorugispora endophytica]TDQ52234.1 type I restriction enzyme S subunit [Actinorugispora endophytica]
MSEWPIRKLGDLCTKITVGHVGSMASRYVTKGVPFLRSQNVKPGRIDLSSLKYIDEEFHRHLAKSDLSAGDLVIVRTGEPGVAAVIPEGLGKVNCSDLVIAKPGPDVDVRFLCYAINETAHEFIKAHTVGAVQQHFNIASAKELTLQLPPLIEQEAIAEALGALDDKIAVNGRIAADIETLLRSIYTSLSVGRRTIRIGQVGNLVRDSIKPDSLSGGEPYIGLEHMPRKSIWLNSWGEASGVSSVKSAFKDGDILFGKLRPYFHKVGIAQISGVCSTDIIVVRALEDGCRSWLLMALSSDEVVAHATARSDGTRMPRAKWSDLAEFQAPWAEPVKVARFEEIAVPLIKKAECGAAENRTLASLRDTLLPQLMSGKLRVRDAERIVEDAV